MVEAYSEGQISASPTALVTPPLLSNKPRQQPNLALTLMNGRTSLQRQALAATTQGQVQRLSDNFSGGILILNKC